MTKRIGAAALALVLAGCGRHGGSGAPAPMMKSLTLNTEAPAALTAADPHLADGSIYQLWHFRGRAHDMIEIDMASGAFDAYVTLQDGDGRELAHDDDSGEGTNARLLFALPADGDYRVVARSYHPGQAGAYRIGIRRLGEVIPGGNGSEIRRGQLVSGTLALNDQRLSDNSVYHSYTYQAHAGEALQIDVMSSEFDAFVILQDPAGNEVARDDDSGEGTDARIVTTFRQTGIYHIIVNTYSAGASGAYTLWVH